MLINFDLHSLFQTIISAYRLFEVSIVTRERQQQQGKKNVNTLRTQGYFCFNSPPPPLRRHGEKTAGSKCWGQILATKFIPVCGQVYIKQGPLRGHQRPGGAGRTVSRWRRLGRFCTWRGSRSMMLFRFCVCLGCLFLCVVGSISVCLRLCLCIYLSM